MNALVPFFAVTDNDVAQFRSEVGTFTHQAWQPIQLFTSQSFVSATCGVMFCRMSRLGSCEWVSNDSARNNRKKENRPP